jgi:hypothetical protein
MAVSATAGVHSPTHKPRVRLSALQVNVAAAVMSLSMRGCYLGWHASPGAEHGSHISQTTSAKLVDVSPGTRLLTVPASLVSLYVAPRGQKRERPMLLGASTRAREPCRIRATAASATRFLGGTCES